MRIMYKTLSRQLLNFKEVTKVNKSELITSMAEKSKLTKKDAETALKAFIEVLKKH